MVAQMNNPPLVQGPACPEYSVLVGGPSLAEASAYTNAALPELSFAGRLRKNRTVHREVLGGRVSVREKSGIPSIGMISISHGRAKWVGREKEKKSTTKVGRAEPVHSPGSRPASHARGNDPGR